MAEFNEFTPSSIERKIKTAKKKIEKVLKKSESIEVLCEEENVGGAKLGASVNQGRGGFKKFFHLFKKSKSEANEKNINSKFYADQTELKEFGEPNEAYIEAAKDVHDKMKKKDFEVSSSNILESIAEGDWKVNECYASTRAAAGDWKINECYAPTSTAEGDWKSNECYASTSKADGKYSKGNECHASTSNTLRRAMELSKKLGILSKKSKPSKNFFSKKNDYETLEESTDSSLEVQKKKIDTPDTVDCVTSDCDTLDIDVNSSFEDKKSSQSSLNDLSKKSELCELSRPTLRIAIDISKLSIVEVLAYFADEVGHTRKILGSRIECKLDRTKFDGAREMKGKIHFLKTLPEERLAICEPREISTERKVFDKQEKCKSKDATPLSGLKRLEKGMQDFFNYFSKKKSSSKVKEKSTEDMSDYASRIEFLFPKKVRAISASCSNLSQENLQFADSLRVKAKQPEHHRSYAHIEGASCERDFDEEKDDLRDERIKYESKSYNRRMKKPRPVPPPRRSVPPPPRRSAPPPPRRPAPPPPKPPRTYSEEENDSKDRRIRFRNIKVDLTRNIRTQLLEIIVKDLLAFLHLEDILEYRRVSRWDGLEGPLDIIVTFSSKEIRDQVYYRRDLVENGRQFVADELGSERVAIWNIARAIYGSDNVCTSDGTVLVTTERGHSYRMVTLKQFERFLARRKKTEEFRNYVLGRSLE